MKRTINAIAPASAAVVSDVPDNGQTPAICLSAHISDVEPCVLTRAEQMSEAAANAEKSGAASAGAAYLDFRNYLCNETSCPPIIGNVLVYRDAHHLTASSAGECLT